MANHPTPFTRSTPVYAKLASVFAALLLASPNLWALGLGNLDVQSNLDQPLRGLIELRTNASDDLDSVKASIASRADFESLGIDYPSYLRDIDLSVNQVGESMVLTVDSGDIIISEPFIHFLVRVDWSGGSFLREYTALIDPPIYAADTPNAIAEPKLVGTDQSYAAPEVEDFVAEPVDESDVVAAEISEPEVIDDSTDYIDSDIENDVANRDTSGSYGDSDEYYQPEAVSNDPSIDGSTGDLDGVGVSESSNSEQADQLQLGTDAQYGPVEAGESLSVIASELQNQFPDLSIYQIMQVMFEENQSAFINGNINGLIKGTVLNIGDLNVIRAVDIEQSKNFFRQQLEDWDPSLLASGNTDSIRVGQDEYNFDSTDYTDTSTSSGVNSGQSETDNFQVGASGDSASFVSDANDNSSAGEVIAMRSQITELQTSLASSSLENQELTERISILEGQLADMNSLMNMSVEDADMANLEATLAAQNNADDDLLVVDANDELNDSLADGASDDEFADSNIESLVDADYVDNLLADSTGTDTSSDEIDTLNSLSEEGGNISLNDELASASTEVVTEPEQLAAVQSKPKTVPVVAKQSFLDKAKDALFTNGLWRILAGVGALLLLGLVLLVMRRRRADEEFEISMMSLGTHSQTLDEDSPASASMSASMTAASINRELTTDKETSFLTVYSDSDAVVQADEVDPIAEADVYIAYGRDEQAEEVLLDGVTSNPARLDIKHKLLGLYHKNHNTEGFERVAEELYSQRDLLTAEVWVDVCKMGKDLASDNPLFDLSPEDIETAGSADGQDNYADEPQVDAEAATEEPELATATLGAAADELVDLSENLELSGDEVDVVSEMVGDALDDEGHSIHLINFDDGRSEISELDDIEIDALDLDGDDDEVVDFVATDDDESAVSDVVAVESGSIEIDLSDELELDSVEFESSMATPLEEASIIAEPAKQSEPKPVAADAEEVSDLEIEDDYDEARTQYELAKVFVDLGDEDGARKILNEIVDNTDNASDVLSDASELLEKIS